MELGAKIIYCIGDSHVAMFTGQDKIGDGWPCILDSLPNFRTYRIGSYLAYNTCIENHQSRKSLIHVLNSIPRESYVLLSFGEIDCRAHLIKQKEIQKRPIEELVDECVNRYFKTINWVVSQGFKVIVYAVPATCNIDIFEKNNEEIPLVHYGSFKERNYATKLFNDTLKKLCEENKIMFLSIFDYLVDENGRTKKEEFYVDSVHLNQKARQLIMNELIKL